MDNKERAYKLIEELQDRLSSNWNIDSISAYRGVNGEGKKVLIVEVELSE